MMAVGPMPSPHTEEPERFPGGADAIDEQPRYGETPDGPIGVDLPPDLQPGGADVPLEIAEPDDKSQEPDEDKSGGDADPEPPV
jgi:hypothetical protein